MSKVVDCPYKLGAAMARGRAAVKAAVGIVAD